MKCKPRCIAALFVLNDGKGGIVCAGGHQKHKGLLFVPIHGKIKITFI